MFKILIVDDEKKHRNGLSRLLYTIYPEDMLLEAESGEQALEVMKLLECDILITDIRMPGMNGMELVQKVRKEFKETEIVILSGYGEFDYAKEAIKYGVSDYLLKPVDTGEVKRCLNKIRSEIVERRNRLEDQETMKSHLLETESIYMEYLMQQFVRNAQFEKKERIREIFPIEQPGYLFLCEAKAEKEVIFNVSEFRMAMKSYIHFASSYSFRTEEKNLYAILVLDKSKGDKNWFEKMSEMLKKIQPGCTFSFYASAHHANMYESMPAAYTEAVTVRQYKFYELGEWYDYEDLKEKTGKEPEKEFNALSTVIDEVKQNNIIQAFQMIKEYVSGICRDSYPNPTRLCRAVMLLLFQIVKALDPLLGEEMKRKTDEALMKIYQADTLGCLQRFIYSFLLELGKNINFQKEVKGIDVLEHCREYLEKHYMEEITLETVAEKYYFNSSYFSTIFKNYFEKSFSNYLTELRMYKAKEFLTGSDGKIKEIANKAGYKDANYFIRAFKKFYGYTPEEYRKLKVQDEG